MQTCWTDFKKEAAVLDAFDVQKAVASVLGRLKKAAEEGKTIQGRAEALAEAQALVAALTAEPAPREDAPL